jgi:hypothetical protein
LKLEINSHLTERFKAHPICPAEFANLWRRRPAGGFYVCPRKEKRRQDAGATKNFPEKRFL